MCDANANVIANGNTSEFTRPANANAGKDKYASAVEVIFQDDRQ